MAISGEQSDIYAAYVAHFSRALLGQSPPPVEMNLEELTAAALGVFDAKLARPLASIGAVLDRVATLHADSPAAP